MKYIKAKEVTEDTFIKLMAEYLKEPSSYHPGYMPLLTEEFKRRVQEKIKEILPSQNTIPYIFEKEKNNTTMITKNVVPDKNEDVVNASNANQYTTIAIDKERKLTGVIVVAGPRTVYIQWSNNTETLTYPSFAALVNDSAKWERKIIFKQIEIL